MRDRPAPFSVRLSVITGPAVAGPDRESGGDIPARGGHSWFNPGLKGRSVLPLREGAYPTMRSDHVG